MEACVLYSVEPLILIGSALKGPLIVDPTAFAVSATNSPIDEAVRQWNAARAALAETLQAYIDAFTQFKVAHVQHFQSHERGVERPDIPAAIYEETVSLVSYQDSIATMKTNLLQLYNTSNPASPISRLPVEILTRIFTLSVGSFRSSFASIRFRDESIDEVNDIASVCSYWRNIAINTPSLWSYIDFDRMSQAELIPLWLERARNHPLDIVSQSTPYSWFVSHLPIYCLRSAFLRLTKYSGESWASD